MNSQIADPGFKTLSDILIFYINKANVEQAYCMLKDGEIDLEIPNNKGETPLHVKLI